MADEPLLFTCSHGPEDPERATVPFILAATAAIAGQKVVVVCTVEGSWMGTERIREVEQEGFPPAIDLRTTLVEAGGEVWICGACATKRSITAEDTSDGCTIVGAARIVEALVAGKAFSAA